MSGPADDGLRGDDLAAIPCAHSRPHGQPFSQLKPDARYKPIAQPGEYPRTQPVALALANILSGPNALFNTRSIPQPG